MSQITAEAGMWPDEAAPTPAALRPENVTMREGGGRSLSLVLLVVGLVGLGVTVAVGAGGGVSLKQALAAYHIGVMAVLALCLGATFFTMAFHLVGAGWSVTMRRQFENVMSLVPIAALMALALIVFELLPGNGRLFTWLDGDLTRGDLHAARKSTYLNAPFFVLRAIFYIFVWTYLSRRLWWYSTEQDRTGDKWLTNRARFTSSWGMPVFALTTAFAAFDWLMSVDYRFFSTMWGVYYFAGAAFSSVPLIVIVLTCIRRTGKMAGCVTEEHYHDLGKLMFAFTVFWAYIAFSQYFLIWYSDIPEETSFYLARKTGGWEGLSAFICWGHFIIPFLILLWRFARRNAAFLSLMAAWAILMEVVDLYWIVRPMVYASDAIDKVHLDKVWIDAAGILGVFAIFLALLVRKIHSGPLVPLKDPRLAEALHHKNYV